MKAKKTPKFGKLLAELALVMIFVILPLKDMLILAEDEPAEGQEIELSDEEFERKRRSAAFLNRVQAEIQSSEDQLSEINEDLIDTQSKLAATRTQIISLADQIDNIELNIESTEQIIENLRLQVKNKQAEILQTEFEIEQKEIEVSHQKRMFSEYLKVIYQKQNDFNSLDVEAIELNTLKLLLGEDSAGEALIGLRYSEIFENEGRQMITTLAALLEEQELTQQLLEIKKHTLSVMEKQMKNQKADLEAQKVAKADLLERTKGQEEIFQELLEKSRRQQDQVLIEVKTLRDNMSFIKERMAYLGDSFDPALYEGLISDAKQIAIYQYLNEPGNNPDFNPIWPVSPARGITAYFQDASYRSYFGFAHNAIDLRAYQGTPIQAAADGIVYKAQDNGYGYSYIILAHKNDFMTVYGHILDFNVETGDIVQAGDTIGLSGGMPGTRGAGAYTTGPHLHYEIIHNDKHVDPLYYMNLAYVQLESLPEKYLAKALGDREKVKVKKDKVRVKPRGLTPQELAELNGNQARVR